MSLSPKDGSQPASLELILAELPLPESLEDFLHFGFMGCALANNLVNASFIPDFHEQKANRHVWLGQPVPQIPH